MPETVKRVSRNLFKRGEWYYFRWMENGQDRRISLLTKDLAEARGQARELRQRLVLANFARTEVTVSALSVSQVLEFYRKAGCPLRSGAPRLGKQLKEEHRRLENLKRWMGEKKPESLTASDWSEYAKRRQSEFKNGGGERTLDLEWVTLSTAFRYAAKHPKETGIFNGIPIPRPERHRRASEVIHCREFQPAGAEELHTIAEYFLLSSRSEVFGWFVLLASMVGQRMAEMLKLRIDARKGEPGFDDGEHLWLYRSKTHKGTAATVEIGPELRQTLNAHQAWIKDKQPKAKWFFPSPRNPGQPIRGESITHALPRACAKLGIPPRTAHGLRAYFVNVLRSRGLPDSEIALRIGHKSGGRLIVETYGERLPGRLEWIPETAPAWQRFDPTRPKIVAADFG